MFLFFLSGHLRQVLLFLHFGMNPGFYTNQFSDNRTVFNLLVITFELTGILELQGWTHWMDLGSD